MFTWPSGVVGLTGSSGSGKSTVAEMFRSFGAKVIDADQLSKQALSPEGEGFAQVVRKFGDGVVDCETGTLNRRELGRIVFGDPKKRQLLEEIVHPIVEAAADREYQKAIADGAARIIYDCPLFFEVNLDRQPFLASIVVVAPQEVIIERLMKRDNRTREEIIKRLANQLSPEEKIARATFVLHNDGTRDDLLTRATALYRQLPTFHFH